MAGSSSVYNDCQCDQRSGNEGVYYRGPVRIEPQKNKLMSFYPKIGKGHGTPSTGKPIGSVSIDTVIFSSEFRMMVAKSTVDKMYGVSAYQLAFEYTSVRLNKAMNALLAKIGIR